MGRQTSERAALHGKPEVDDVAVAHDVVLALEAELPRLAALRLAAQADEVLVRDHLGADEAALDVAVDLAGRLERRRAPADRPCAALVLARGEKADEVEERVARADEAGARAFRETEVGEERVAIARVELRDLGLEPRGERHLLGAFGTCTCRHIGGQRRGGIGLGHVQHDEERPEREEREARELGALLRRQRERPERLPGLELGREALEERALPLVTLLLPDALETLLDHAEVGEDELGGERVEVRDGRRRAAADVGEAAHDLDERVGVAQLGDRAGVEHGAALRADGREVDERDLGVRRLPRLPDAGERVDARVGDLDDAEARRIAPGSRRETGERAEDGRLPRAREAREADLHDPPSAAAARWSAQIVFPSTISPRRIIASTSVSGIHAISVITSSAS